MSDNKNLKSGELADDEDANPLPEWEESVRKLLADTTRMLRGDFETSSESSISRTTSASLEFRTGAEGEQLSSDEFVDSSETDVASSDKEEGPTEAKRSKTE